MYKVFSLFWFMVFDATYNNIHLNSGSQFYWWRKQKYPVKITNVGNHCQTLSHNDVSSTPRREWGLNSQC